MESFGIASVASITVICYLLGMACKSTDKVKDNYIPVIMGASGAVLGAVALFAMPDFPATDIINAVAIGIVSGLAATGVNQLYKQLKEVTR